MPFGMDLRLGKIPQPKLSRGFIQLFLSLRSIASGGLCEHWRDSTIVIASEVNNFIEVCSAWDCIKDHEARASVRS